MPAITANAKNFLISSDFPMDKIVLLHSGQIDFTTSGTDYTFAHGLSFTPLIKATWSTSSDFSTTYGIGDGPLSSNPSFAFLPELAFARADSSNVYLSFGNPDMVNNAYIRIYGFMPSDVDVDTDLTASAADSFTLDSDYNYTKLYTSGVTSSSSVAGSSETVTHSLGYYPQVEVWFEKDGYIWVSAQPAVKPDLGIRESETFELTISSLTMYRNASLSGTERFHYRIYTDEL